MTKQIHFKFLLFILLYITRSQSLAQIDESAICEVVLAWSENHNQHRPENFHKLFATEVIFYGQELSGDKAVLKKSALLNSQPDFRQELIGGMTISLYDSGLIKCDFTKEVFTKGKLHSYPSYLLLRKIGEKYLICGESDLITDKNLHYHLSLGKEVNRQTLKIIETNKSNFILPIIIGSVLLIASITLLYIIRKRKKSISQNKVSEETLNTSNENMEMSPVPDNYAKGLEFEKFVVTKFNQKYFKLVNWRSDKGSNGRFPESNSYPDIEMKYTQDFYERSFAIECKYRQKTTWKKTISVAQEYQLANYRKFERDKQMPVYVVIGIGGKASSPEEIFVIPLNKIKSTEITYAELGIYKKDIRHNFYWVKEEGILT